jgi:hypothetical protein
MTRSRVFAIAIAASLVATASSGLAMRAPEVPAEQAAVLKRDFATSLSKLKGPFTENFCVCRHSNAKIPVRNAAGRITSPCGNDALFCAAFRAPWAQSLANNRVWIANIFSRDLWLWPEIADHHDLVRGFILEKYFVDTNPKHKLAELRAFGGLSGSEYETGASTQMFERYLAEPGFDDSRHFPLAYELQRRYFVRDDLGQIEKVRSMSVRIQAAQPKFKPFRDAIHNQLSPSLIPKLAAYRDTLPSGGVRSQVEALLIEMSKLTTLDDSAMRTQLPELSDAALRAKFSAMMPAAGSDPVATISALGKVMLEARRAVAAHGVSAADARRLIDLDITAGAVLQSRATALLEGKQALSARQDLELLAASVDGAYGAGLLVAREHEAARKTIGELLANDKPARGEFAEQVRQIGRTVEWTQANATLPYSEVWPQWTLLMPQVAMIGDDVLRSSPMLLFAQIYTRLDDYAAGSGAKKHEIFGTEVTGGLRVLNPGLAVGKLRVAPKENAYSRSDVVALAETPTELEPAAGILTRGEGNVLSHVQLLARSLGIPNVVLGPDAFARARAYDGKVVFYVATPGGRTIVKELTSLTNSEKAAWGEYTGNETRSGAGTFGAGTPKLHIEKEKIDLSKKLPIDLAEIRRSDSGRLCGPKGAFLGELKHLFPDKVARGIVVPFGAYHDHFERAPVAVPPSLASAGIATAGEKLRAFVERTYAEFFGRLIPKEDDPQVLTAWIAPRLEVVRYRSVRASTRPVFFAARRKPKPPAVSSAVTRTSKTSTASTAPA